MAEPEDALMPVPGAMDKLFQDGPTITLSGVYDDAAEPPEPCDCEDCLILRSWIRWQGWARARRN